MLRASIGFFIIGLLAIALGANGVGGVSLEVGRLLLFVFMGLAILSFLGALLTGRSPKTPTLILAGILSLSYALPHRVHADESLSDKANNAAGDMSTDAKKGHRKAKRSARKATGKDNAMKDAKDGVNDAGDDISNGAKKLKRKAD